MSSGALERVVRRGHAAPVEPGERCDLCAAELSEHHRHMVDTDSGQLRCVCRPCSVLFDRPAASDGHYRLIPQRRRRLDGVAPGELGVPVGLAFFVPGPDGAVTAHYPSPLGTTRWEVDPSPWAGVRARCRLLDDLRPEVEALLVNTTQSRREAWLVPIDDCYRLVAVIRKEWRGLTGGDEVWPSIDRFFDQLQET